MITRTDRTVCCCFYRKSTNGVVCKIHLAAVFFFFVFFYSCTMYTWFFGCLYSGERIEWWTSVVQSKQNVQRKKKAHAACNFRCMQKRITKLFLQVAQTIVFYVVESTIFEIWLDTRPIFQWTNKTKSTMCVCMCVSWTMIKMEGKRTASNYLKKK